METGIETMEDLRIELATIGYSEKAIQEIFKWIPATKKYPIPLFANNQ
jgi:hypothetical protein